MKLIKYPGPSDWPLLSQRATLDDSKLSGTVQQIIEEVRQKGDQALFDYTSKFDKVDLKNIEVMASEFSEATEKISDELNGAIAIAKANIEKFHQSQFEVETKVETSPGVVCWRRGVAIESVGLYIPGGSAPLFSTILMLAIPARLAGCKEIILSSPADKSGEIHPAILYTASLLGITKVYKVGGAQAIAAMAYGTKSVPKVNKIFGPGNQYVTKAKALIQQTGVAIDMPAGPSEVLVIADKSANPEFIAADLLSQAEHGPDSQVIVVSDNIDTLEQSLKQLEIQLTLLPREAVASEALKNSKAILFSDLAECIAFSNCYAPEHLILACEAANDLAKDVTNAGSVFLGNYSCESVGDYASGTNHTLPTNGYATAYSGVSLDSFLKKITFQHVSEKGIQSVGPATEIMAEAEGLDAHKNAVSVRLKYLNNV